MKVFWTNTDLNPKWRGARAPKLSVSLRVDQPLRCIYNIVITLERVRRISDRNRNRNLKTSKALLKSQAHQGTSLFTSAATNQRGVSKGGSREAQVRIPEYQEG